jgi:ABC-type antimicrobial peptide transport system permease subunit
MFILAIAAISLFVGGVGVANIMLVAVTERTREIGIRKAIGAPRRAIMRQFLSEAVMLTALGGLVGSILGIGLCLIGKIAIPKLWPPDPTSLTPTPVPLLTLWPVLIAFGVSLVIGLLAGGYPAYRAARLRPIDALRFE